MKRRGLLLGLMALMLTGAAIMVVWFDETHPPYDFSINTSPANLASFQNGMNQSFVIKQI